MADIEDPRAALGSSDVSVRAAAARQLAAVGSFDDVEALIDLAKGDKSPSVRLYTAAAAADIALRYSGANGSSTLTRAQRASLVHWVTTVDPSANPSLLMVLAAIPDEKNIVRLGRLLRDPRYEVRAGAATTVRRMALSAANVALAQLPAAIRSWLTAGRHPQDAVLEMVKISGQAGWSGMASALRQAITAGRPHGEAVELAARRQAERVDPSTWVGLWVSKGVDVHQAEPEVASDWRFIGEDGVVYGGDGSTSTLEVTEDGATLDGRRVRRIWVGRLAEAGEFEALQSDGVTYWRRSDKALVTTAIELVERIGAVPEAGRGVARQLEQVEGVVATRTRGLVLWRSGALAEAEALLEPMIDGKKPKAEVLWWLANIKLGLGDLDSARELAARAVDNAPKKADWRADAEALRASLGG